MRASEFNKKKVYSESSGVTAIVEPNIKIILNEYGVYEEVIIDNNDITLNSNVEVVSPNLNVNRNESDIASELYGDIDGINFDSRLGYYSSLYVGYVSDDNYRMNASSGGMGTWIFTELFNENLIDGVIHVKKVENESDSRLFKYDISRNVKEILNGAKTKYYPVELSEVLEIVKNVPGRYAVIGIPSFIMAIRLLAEVDEVVKERIKFTVGLICGHQKSSKFAESLAWQLGINPRKITNIDFRKKLLDRPANEYGIEVSGEKNGEEVSILKPASELLAQNWGHGFFKVKASDFTDDVMNETADITIGDAWLPEYTNDSNGNNVVIVRNSTIDLLIKKAIEDDRLHLDEVDSETMFRSQSAHYRHTHDELAYRLYKVDQKGEWRPNKRVLASNQAGIFRKRVQDLREIISVSSHFHYAEAQKNNNFDIFVKRMSKPLTLYSILYRIIGFKKLGIRGLSKKILNKLIRIIKIK